VTTLVAHRSGVIVADSMACAMDRVVSLDAEKATVVGSSVLLGLAGGCGGVWLQVPDIERGMMGGGLEGEALEDRAVRSLANVFSGNEEACGVAVARSQRMWFFGGCGRAVQLETDYFALGSGAEIALGFLDCWSELHPWANTSTGQDWSAHPDTVRVRLTRAVEAAAKRDPFTGGEIKLYGL